MSPDSPLVGSKGTKRESDTSPESNPPSMSMTSAVLRLVGGGILIAFLLLLIIVDTQGNCEWDMFVATCRDGMVETKINYLYGVLFLGGGGLSLGANGLLGIRENRAYLELRRSQPAGEGGAFASGLTIRPRRFAAFLFDMLLILCIVFPVGLILAGVASSHVALVVAIDGGLLLSGCYFAWGTSRGQTIGKKRFGIAVVKFDSLDPEQRIINVEVPFGDVALAVPGWSKAILRTLVGCLGAFYFVTYFWFFREHGRTVGDLASKTTVVIVQPPLTPKGEK